MTKVIAKETTGWFIKDNIYWCEHSDFCGGCYHIYTAPDKDAWIYNVFNKKIFDEFFDIVEDKNMSPWEKVAAQLEEVDYGERMFICGECGEPIHEADFGIGTILEAGYCPICGAALLEDCLYDNYYEMIDEVECVEDYDDDTEIEP